jgi:membrane protein YqaA with SNARE-associated domain
VSGFFQSMFGVFLSWWGVLVIGALDSSMLFFLPFGIDALVIYLAASNETLFWAYPLLATAGSLTGAALTFWIGKKGGEAGLHRFLPERRIERIQHRVRNRGAIAMAVPAILPPPFPFTPFILTCGALEVDRWRFFGTLATVRLLRFGTEALFARTYGSGILRVLQSDTFRMIVFGFVLVAVVGTIASAVVLWRRSHRSG